MATEKESMEPKTGKRVVLENGLTQKEENFALAFAETGNASESYREAYNAKNMKAETIHVKACVLKNKDNVAVRIRGLQQAAIERNKITVDDLIKELEEARIMASTADTVQSSSMVSATMGKAKLLGLVVDRSEVKATLADMTDDELARKRIELERKLAQSTKD